MGISAWLWRREVWFLAAVLPGGLGVSAALASISNDWVVRLLGLVPARALACGLLSLLVGAWISADCFGVERGILG